MRLHRLCWVTASSLFTFAGIVLTPLTIRFGAALAAAVLGLLAVVLVGGIMREHLNGATAAALPMEWFARVGSICALVAVATVTLVTAFGGPVLLVVATLAATCPPAIWRAELRRLRTADPAATDNRDVNPGPVRPVPGPRVSPVATHLSYPPPSAERAGTRPPSEFFAQLRGATSAEHLCRCWRTSYVMLQQTTSPTLRLQIVEARHTLLDRLAQCDPASFARWIDDGARAASDPTRYFAAKPTPRSAADRERQRDRR